MSEHRLIQAIRACPDLPELKQIEAERLDLREVGTRIIEIL